MRAPIQNLERLHSKRLLPDFKARLLKEHPYIVKINSLISDEEIEDLLDLTKGKFERSNIVVDGELILSKTRTSRTAYICKDGLPYKESRNIEKFIKRICYLTDCKREQIEGLMVVKYKYGEKFDAHVDYFREDEIGVLDDGGQRVATFFVYLNDVDKKDGGSTEFTELGIRSYPKKGDALFWFNQDPKSGEMMPETMHRGNPILTKGAVKYGLNVWIRENEFY